MAQGADKKCRFFIWRRLAFFVSGRVNCWLLRRSSSWSPKSCASSLPCAISADGRRPLWRTYSAVGARGLEAANRVSGASAPLCLAGGVLARLQGLQQLLGSNSGLRICCHACYHVGSHGASQRLIPSFLQRCHGGVLPHASAEVPGSGLCKIYHSLLVKVCCKSSWHPSSEQRAVFS